MKLYPYQQDGAAWLAGKRTALLADEPGLGKTAQAIMAAHQIGAKTVLVICPASVRQNWVREFARFWPAGGGGCQLCVHSYDSAARGALNTALGESEWDVLILDEAHYLKNKDSKRTQAIYGKGGLMYRANNVFALTGTPTPNNPSEIYTHLRALAPGLIMKRNEHPMSYWEFVGRYCKTYDNGFGPVITGGKNLDKLREKIAPFILRRKKAEVLQDLPPIRFDVLPMEAACPKMGSGYMADVLETEGLDGLAKHAVEFASVRRLTGLAKVEPVLQWVKEQLDGGLEKIVLFAYHRDVLVGLSGAIPLDEHVGIDGSHSSEQRQRAVDRFQNDPGCRVFIGQIQAAGTGITLTAASDLLFVESSWVPAENEQAAMRIHRIGQKSACLVRFATIAGSIDEQIAKACARKMEDIREMFD